MPYYLDNAFLLDKPWIRPTINHRNRWLRNSP